ncbi:MAG TPA: AbrB family transcriptional regulator [Paracoccus sp. (in: a-proteobacteria)]|uniref:AbrB family transcriptional regulator n=1 Tax=uncultured Paracoccus sp. TaxID=189685 RepID=UPI0026386E6B|nr:AbrB family transcriptional regulator [uncultured Paracoccus sp.]HMQ40703.1 AbrB family transcriptional regulator [Paracoccus sp. (in: a-proteobacteria)]HMR37128.1 AbrB family transcriptional regulator [Paracoccus sp. (in: a-proteobacteria)]
MTRTRHLRRLGTLLLAVFGTAVFSALHMPLPFLFGPMFACLIAALMGAPLLGAKPISDAARTILGVAVGASITPAVIHQIPQMAGSVAFVPLYIAAIGLVGVPYFHKICGFDLPTSYFAAMPGGLQDMVLFGKEAGGDVRALSLIHATRVLVIVTIVPAILVYAMDRPLVQPVGAPAIDLPLTELLLMAAAAILGWKVAERIGLFGAAILGPMIVTAALSLSGMIEHRPPREAILGAQFFIGMGIGVGYVGVTLLELRRIVLSGMIFVLILAVLAFAVTEAVVQLGLATPIEGFLSFAPGGQAEMTVLAIVAGADLGFIVVHHLVRLTLVILGAPLMAGVLGLRSKPDRTN